MPTLRVKIRLSGIMVRIMGDVRFFGQALRMTIHSFFYRQRFSAYSLISMPNLSFLKTLYNHQCLFSDYHIHFFVLHIFAVIHQLLALPALPPLLLYFYSQSKITQRQVSEAGILFFSFCLSLICIYFKKQLIGS